MQGSSPSGGSREHLSLPPAASGGGRHSWAHRCMAAISASRIMVPSPLLSVVRAPSLSLMRTLVIVFRTHRDNLGRSSHRKILNHIYK